jgi:hypothetical protein
MIDQRRFKIVLLAFAVLALGLISYQFALYWSHRGLIKANIVVLPEDSTLTIDGSPKKPGTVYLKPGLHKFAATREFFDKVERRINTNSLKADETIYLLPEANSSEALKWLTEHPEVQQKREAVGGVEAIKQQDSLTTNYPFIKTLPKENSHYKIDYSITSGNKLEFTINLFGSIDNPDQYTQYRQRLKQYKSEALQFLKVNGINSSDFKITYIPNI